MLLAKRDHEQFLSLMDSYHLTHDRVVHRGDDFGFETVSTKQGPSAEDSPAVAAKTTACRGTLSTSHGRGHHNPGFPAIPLGA